MWNLTFYNTFNGSLRSNYFSLKPVKEDLSITFQRMHTTIYHYSFGEHILERKSQINFQLLVRGTGNGAIT